MLINCKVTSSITFTAAISTPGWRKDMWQKSTFPKNRTQCPQAGLKPGPLYPGKNVRWNSYIHVYLALKVKHLFICSVYCFCGIIAPWNLEQKIKYLRSQNLISQFTGNLIQYDLQWKLGQSDHWFIVQLLLKSNWLINQLYLTSSQTNLWSLID